MAGKFAGQNGLMQRMTSSHLYPTASRDYSSARDAGFRFGAKGTHTSRTIMLEEFTALLAETKPDAARKDYAAAIVDMNCLAKPTAASRRLTNQRIRELYALDLAMPLFRVLRRLWELDHTGRPLLAVQCAIARDPLLAATAPPVLSLPPGAELQRDTVTTVLRELVGERMNESVLAKVVRNAASSWTQAGHLAGRTFKKRQLVVPTACTVAFGLYLGHLIGFRGADLFNSGWIVVLDCAPPQARELALEAKRMGLLDLRLAGDIVELNLDRLDPMAA